NENVRGVLIDEPRVKLLHSAAARLIVIIDEIDFIALAACLDAARGINLVAPKLVAALLTERVDIERTGLGIGKADSDGVFGKSRRGGRRENSSRPQQKPKTTVHFISSH